MSRITAFVVLALVLPGGVGAQTGPGAGDVTVMGRVVDAGSQELIEYANAVLYSLPESTQVTGMATDKNGEFRLDGVKPGRYYLELSFIGYRSKTVDDIECAGGAKLDLGRIALEQKPVSVEGVEATAEKQAITRKLDKTVIDVSKLPNATSGNATDALQNVPAVKVDIEGNVTMRGSGNFTVLIDGRPTPLEPSEALKQIPAPTIDKIEIITNPSAKYDPDGAAGIINVLLKKELGRGMSALVNADAGFQERYGGDALLSCQQGIVKAHAGGNIGHRASVNGSESESRTFGASETLLVTTKGTNEWGMLYGGGRAGVELQFGPRDKSSISGRLGGFDGGSVGHGEETQRHLPGDSSKYGNHGIWEWARNYRFVTADHAHDFDTSGHKLVARATWVHVGGTSVSGSEQLNAADVIVSGRRTEEPGPMDRLNLQLDYTLPTRGEDKFEAGHESRIERTDQDYRLLWYDTTARVYELDSGSCHSYVGTNDIHALYATYSWSWNKLGVQPGLRGEYGNRVIRVLDTDTTWTVGRWDYFPSLHLSYGLPANQQLTASYSRRIDRPWPWMLRPFPTWNDAHNVSQGDPELRPSYTNSWEAGYELTLGVGSISTQGYCRTTADMSEWVTMKYPADTTVLLQTARNVGHDLSLGGEVTTNLSPVKWFTAYLTGDVYHYREEGSLLGQSFDKQTIAWSTSLNLDFRFPTNTQLSLNSDLSGPTITATSVDDGWVGADAAVKQTLFNRALSVTLRLSNLFGARTWRSTSEGAGFKTRGAYTGDGRVLSLALSYNFNNFQFDPKMRAGEGMEMQGAPGPGR